jgi:UDP-glucose 6-dehydrogenase
LPWARPRSRAATSGPALRLRAAEQIVSSIDRFTVVITKSTVPVGTNRQVQTSSTAIRGRVDGGGGLEPEFLREGSAIQDFMHPDRVVFGTLNEQAAAIMHRIYLPLQERGCTVLATDIEPPKSSSTPRMRFLAVKVSYINEIADLCEAWVRTSNSPPSESGSTNASGRRFSNPGRAGAARASRKTPER